MFSVHVSEASGLCKILNPVQAALPEVLGVQLRLAVRLVVCATRKFVGAMDVGLMLKSSLLVPEKLTSSIVTTTS